MRSKAIAATVAVAVGITVGKLWAGLEPCSRTAGAWAERLLFPWRRRVRALPRSSWPGRHAANIPNFTFVLGGSES
jgi:hypothetical protein